MSEPLPIPLLVRHFLHLGVLGFGGPVATLAAGLRAALDRVDLAGR